MSRHVPKLLDPVCSERAYDNGRRADDQRAIGEDFPLWDQRICPHKAAGANARAIQHCGAHADQRTGADAAPMHDRAMADGNVFTDDQWKPGVAMQNRILLDVAARADLDRFIVTAHDRAEPDPDIDAKMDTSHYMGIRRDPETPGLGQLRKLIVQSIDWHGSAPRPLECERAALHFGYKITFRQSCPPIVIRARHQLAPMPIGPQVGGRADVSAAFCGAHYGFGPLRHHSFIKKSLQCHSCSVVQRVTLTE